MKLSFNIPTYNRAKFLSISLNKIVTQIEELHLEEQIEINLSDNASTDNTKKVWDKCVTEHPNIKFTYKRNPKNLGPDMNFLSAMHMATGEYSLLWGDDDYLKKGGLKRILELVEYGKNNDINILYSSTDVINNQGHHIRNKNFLRKDIQEFTVDFSNPNEARAYFFLLKDTGGLLSFISSVIYKTSIINDIKYYDEFTGTNYAFLCYWWGWLANGKKLFYSNKPFIDEIEQYQPAYGFGVKRAMIDYKGFFMIANKLLKNTPFAKDFLCAFENTHPILLTRMLYLTEQKSFEKQIYPLMKECGVEETDIKIFLESCSIKNIIKSLLYKILPEYLIGFIKKLSK